MQKLSLALAAIMMASVLPAFGQSTATTTRTMPSCPGDTVVWENTKTKAYHTSGDTYYGTTKHGRYACRAAAEAAGFHAAGMHANGAHSSMKNTAPQAVDGTTSTPPAARSTDVPTTAKHHHRHRGMASPGPMGASPNPSATE